MKNFVRELLTEVGNHNRYKTIAIIFCCSFLLYVKGCDVRCNSILRPGTKINYNQLQAEVDEFSARAIAEANSIQRKEAMRNFVWNAGLNALTTGGFDWLTVLTGAGSVIGIGAVADNVRYRLKFPKA